jgi:hypothetical protein
MSSKQTSIDLKTQRALALNIIGRLQKLLRASDGKDVDELVFALEEHMRLLKFVSSGKKKKTAKKTKKKKAVEGKIMTPAEEEARRQNYMNKLTSHLM